MDPALNPYAPGAGTPPPELTGRGPLLENARIALTRTRNGLPTKSFILVGLRGVGKTGVAAQGSGRNVQPSRLVGGADAASRPRGRLHVSS